MTRFRAKIFQWLGPCRDDYGYKPTEEYVHLEQILAKYKGDPVEALRDLFATGEYLEMKMDILNRLHLLAFAEQNHMKIKVDQS